jgi:hypothetical protein
MDQHLDQSWLKEHFNKQNEPSIPWCIHPLLGRDLEMDEYCCCYAIGR